MRTHPHPRVRASRESASPQFCRTSNRRSLLASHGRVVQSNYQRTKSFFRAQIISKFLCRLLAGNLSCAHTIKSSILQRHLLNCRWRVQLIQTCTQPLGIVALLERAHPHPKKSPKRIGTRKPFHPHPHHTPPHPFYRFCRPPPKINKPVVHERPPL